MSSLQYVGLLRGINVGGKMVSMSELKKSLESIGFLNVATLLNSGNVVFEYKDIEIPELITRFEAKLKDRFEMDIKVLIRRSTEIKSLIEKNPFRNVEVTPQIRLYVTFLSQPPTSKLRLPYETADRSFRILQVTTGEIMSILTLTQKMGTTDGMKILEKEYGKNITTRNWNTVIKIGKLLT